MRKDGEETISQYNIRRTPEQLAKYRAHQRPRKADVEHLRTGIEEFRRLLEQRFGPKR